MHVQRDIRPLRRAPPLRLVLHARRRQHLLLHVAAHEVADAQALAQGGVDAVAPVQRGFGPAPARGGGGQLAGGFLADAGQVVVGWVGGDEVEHRVDGAHGGGVQGGEVEGEEAAGDDVGAELVGPVFGEGEGDVPAEIVVWFLPGEGGVEMFSFEVGEAVVDDGEGVFGGVFESAVDGDGEETTD